MNTVFDKMGTITEQEKEQKWDKGKKHDKHQPKPGSDKFIDDLANKVVACETLSGKTITGVLTGYDTYTLLVVEPKDIKNPNPKGTVIFKHGLVSVRETE